LVNTLRVARDHERLEFVDTTVWAALGGGSAAGAFTLLGVWLSNHHAAKERAADRRHDLDLERARQCYSEAAIRRELTLVALQQFSADAESLIRVMEQTRLIEGCLDVPNKVNVDDLKGDLERSLLALELMATDDALHAAQALVRMIGPSEATDWDTDRSAEWAALGTFRNACRRDLLGETMAPSL
jgi:hypothetical protein